MIAGIMHCDLTASKFQKARLGKTNSNLCPGFQLPYRREVRHSAVKRKRYKSPCCHLPAKEQGNETAAFQEHALVWRLLGKDWDVLHTTASSKEHTAFFFFPKTAAVLDQAIFSHPDYTYTDKTECSLSSKNRCGSRGSLSIGRRDRKKKEMHREV